MKNISSINALVIGQTGLILAIFVSYFIGLFVLNFSVTGAIIVLTLLIFAFIFIANPRIIIYFVLFMLILGRAFADATWVSLGKAYYNLTLSGLVIKGVVIPAGLLLILTKKIRITGHALSAPAIFFIVALGVGIIVAPYKLYSIRNWNVYVYQVVLYLIALEYFKNRKEAEKLFKFILLLSIPTLVVGVKQIFIHPITRTLGGELYGQFRVIGIYEGGAGPLAMLCVVLLLMIIFLFLESRHKLIYIAIFACALILLFYTYSRSAWLSFIGALVISGFISKRHRKFLIIVLTASLIAFLALSGFRTSILERFKLDDSALGRIKVSSYGWKVFKESPIWGVGPGNFSLRTTEIVGGAETGYGFKSGISAHNAYIRYLTEGGILGITAYLFLLYRSLKLSIRVFNSSNLYVKNYGVLLISLVSVLILSSITDNSSIFYLNYIWIFMAIGENYLRGLQAQPQRIQP